ncbi:hypothetical protein [Paenibacillus pinihumi]|uniref:hypothetical protein n=1 Tax=Paenibacillus pinihumi TaxID=669462 RepID=UPI0003FF3CB0|nr:hypothetical protein [Paenibacillus pinihumi]
MIKLDQSKLNQYSISYIGEDQALVEHLAGKGARISINNDVMDIQPYDIIIIDNSMVKRLDAELIKQAVLKNKFVFFDQANNTQDIDRIFLGQSSYEVNKESDQNSIIQLKRTLDNQYMLNGSVYKIDEFRYERLLDVIFKIIDAS